MIVSFHITGVPATAGSKVAGISKSGRRFVRDTCKRKKPWQHAIAVEAKSIGISAPMTGPLNLWMTFYMPRPKSHLKPNGSIRKSAPHEHTQKPDITKMVRCAEDALNGILWVDDSQVVMQRARKEWCGYGEEPGLLVTVEEINVSS